MSNPVKGEVALPIGGRDYTVVFDINAICELEAQFGGRPVGQIVDAWFNDAGDLVEKNVAVSEVRALMWAGLRTHHPELSLQDVGRLLGELGQSGALLKMLEALGAAFPDAEDANGTANPPNRAARRAKKSRDRAAGSAS